MWLFVIIFFGPVVYLLASFIVSSISDKANEIKRKKYHGEEELISFTTYNNANVTNNDIILLFVSQMNKYKRSYYNLEYKIFDKQNEQNYAWSVKTTKQTFGWGDIHNIFFHFSNGWVYLSFSNGQFNSSNKRALPYYIADRDFGSLAINSTLNACRKEAQIMWRMNGNEPTEPLPFNFVPLSDEASSNHSRTENQKESTTQADLLTFYRNLLGLKLHFSHTELKKCYHEAVGKYHPDRYGTSSPRERENAEMLMKQVNEAYERLKEIAA